MKKTRNTLATILHTATASCFRRNGKPMTTAVLSAALCLGLMPVASCTGSSKNEAAPEPETTAAVKERTGTLNPHELKAIAPADARPETPTATGTAASSATASTRQASAATAEQATTPPPPQESATPPAEEETSPADEVYTVVEQPPRFPNGEAALLQYISSHLKYPQSAMEQEIQGVVTLRFVVQSDGSVGEVHIVQGIDAACDAEAVRVIKSLPRFIPGRQYGRPVPVWFTLPIRFQIN